MADLFSILFQDHIRKNLKNRQFCVIAYIKFIHDVINIRYYSINIIIILFICNLVVLNVAK